MIKSIWFDAAGVFVEPIAKRMCLILQAKHSVSAERILEIWERLDMLHDDEGMPETFWARLCADAGIYADVCDVEALYRSLITEVPGTMDIIRALQGRYVLVVANNENKETDHIRDAQLQYFRCFDHLCSSWKIGVSKPTPLFYSTILDIVRMEPQECVFIDDREENLAPARKLGIHTILFKDAQQLKEELRKIGVEV